MRRRVVRRRDFSRHWVFTAPARRVADLARQVAELPARGVSYGPPQPNALCLALPRAACGLLPVPLALALQISGTLLAFYALWIEPHRIGTTREALHSAKLRSATPIRVMHLGDLHVERITDRERRLVDLVAAERPDLIVCSGDLINYSYAEDREAWSACRWIFERLSAPLGTFVVSGSFPADRDESIEHIVTGTPARWLRDERVTIEHRGQVLDLIGLHCTHRPFLERPRLEALLPASRERFTLLLYHTPDLAPDAAELTLYVTRGIGLEGSAAPRMRCLCPPEVVVWEIDGPAA